MWVKGKRADISLVISIESPEEGMIKWHSTGIREQIIDEKGWNHIVHHLDWDLSSLPENALLKVYLINHAAKEISIDGFSVSLFTSPEFPPG